MPLVSRTIPNFVQGVSQQPEVLRLSSQATTQLNGFSSVVEGLKKDHQLITLQNYLLLLLVIALFIQSIETHKKATLLL